MPPRVWVGTSGYSYKEWKGSFYPSDLRDSEMLRYYAQRFPTVEINNTFYRMPTPSVLRRWADEVPAGFRFVLKAPRRITHERRLGDAESLRYFLDAASCLGDRLGPILFQLPPYFQKDLARLQEFLSLLPQGVRAAFEFRHDSWEDSDVDGALRTGGAARCRADTDEDDAKAPIVSTAGWGYLRLRRTVYEPRDLETWGERILAQPWDEAFVFLKHEEAGRGAQWASELADWLQAQQ